MTKETSTAAWPPQGCRAAVLASQGAHRLLWLLRRRPLRWPLLRWPASGTAKFTVNFFLLAPPPAPGPPGAGAGSHSRSRDRPDPAGARLSEIVLQRTEKGLVARSATPQASAGGPPEAVCGGHFPSVFRRAPAAPWLLAVSSERLCAPPTCLLYTSDAADE